MSEANAQTIVPQPLSTCYLVLKGKLRKALCKL